MKKLFSAVILCIASPVFGGPFLESVGGLWLPFWGDFRTNHNLGFALHTRAGWNLSIEGLDIPNLAFDNFGVFVEGYHTWNSLKEHVWEYSGGDTIKSGNIFYIGLGGRATRKLADKLSAHVGLSFGIENEYKPTGEGLPHTPPKNTPASFVFIGAGYHLADNVYLFVEYDINGSSTYTTGWHEVNVGVSLSF